MTDFVVQRDIVLGCRQKGYNHLGYYLGAEVIDKFVAKKDIDFIDAYSILCYYSNHIEEFISHLKFLLLDCVLDFKMFKRTLFNWQFAIGKISSKYVNYNPLKVRQVLDIIKAKKDQKPHLIFTMTSCRRFDLFQKTVNSFLECCLDLDLIDKWICVDDNSPENDRKQMAEMYPFFEFHFKSEQDKGHPRSMNMLAELTAGANFIFHCEDDFQWFVKEKFMTRCQEVLNLNQELGQCLINMNYMETEKDWDITGGFFKKTLSDRPYIEHEFVPSFAMPGFFQKYGTVKQCAYWPYFSFRPGMTRRKVLDMVGPFSSCRHFEMEYAGRYQQRGLKTAFLPGIFNLHIGRLTSERFDQTRTNAYVLNNTQQF